MENKTNLEVLDDISYDHLSDLRINLEILEKRPARIRDDLFFIDILRHCHMMKASAEKSDQIEIKQLMHNFEVVIELLRRQKITESKGIYNFLNEITDAIPKITQNRLSGIPQEPNLIQELREGFEKITNRLFDYKV
jgi:chemotaxis protein histidine kinase CheA